MIGEIGSDPIFNPAVAGSQLPPGFSLPEADFSQSHKQPARSYNTRYGNDRD
jgi:hypothetical protein